LFVLVENDEIYVTCGQDPVIRVFNLADNGDIAPRRTLTGPDKAYGLYLYGNELFATVHLTSGHKINVFPRDGSGNVTPLRTISGDNTGLNYTTGVHVYRNEIFVANYNGNSVTVYNLNDSGDVLPKRTIAGPSTQLVSPHGLWAHSEELFVASPGSHKIVVFNITDSGDVPPKRVISGGNTGFNQPHAVSMLGMGQQSFALTSGWNFISTAVQPPDTAIATVLANIAPRVVWGYNNQSKQWLKYIPGVAGSSLTTFEAGKGYWVYMATPATFTITGEYASSGVTVSEGWNLVGYHGADTRTVSSSLTTLSGKWSLLWCWENSTWSVNMAEPAGQNPFPSLTDFYKGRAYWIKIKKDAGTMEWRQ
jgi:hypothetical protein